VRVMGSGEGAPGRALPEPGERESVLLVVLLTSDFWCWLKIEERDRLPVSLNGRLVLVALLTSECWCVLETV
jgi:hypothetical protein